ncbi:hypothetical protein HUG17_0638 [Dermatophagoides farinae]|uniref:Uncharacterized protein n=1 Tax=Dermatophagoides farinae TaxID=6954 RepID=A0A9D4SL53_DERFA|nr:hypothetical protein HUG17_0638 [Dermatophagoides farinae]
MANRLIRGRRCRWERRDKPMNSSLVDAEDLSGLLPSTSDMQYSTLITAFAGFKIFYVNNSQMISSTDIIHILQKNIL